MKERKRILGRLGRILGGLFLFLALGGEASASTPCPSPTDSGLAVTRFSWSFDARTLTGRAEVVLTNLGRRAVKTPGAMVLAYDSAGKELNQVWGRIKASSLKPGASEALVLVMRLSRLPDGVKATTLEELGGT
ncbi:hypothetical protein [Aminomonas paucivorans]|uniref:Uncharacterized protein n=1 Tax=Aminomonas paucivorans DSM 12260 TaxID=584708 RepID=E3CWX2_9BACT|nr:hypothetical protein [Aminomonas paucivorans]EFQ23422.1 hypothetical protein Apau_0995 [Aminomonas paucivorans DSM 12260]